MADTEADYLADLISKDRKRTAADFVVDASPFIADQTFKPVAESTGVFSSPETKLPTELPVAGLLLGGLGTLFKMSAEHQQASAIRSAASISAEYSERAAADAVQRGNLREFEVTSRGEKILADQLTAQAGTKSDVNVGGQLTTRQASRANLDFDRALVRRNAAMEAYGLRARAQQQRQQGEYEAEAAENAATGTFLKGIASFIGEGGKLLMDNPEILAGA